MFFFWCFELKLRFFHVFWHFFLQLSVLNMLKTAFKTLFKCVKTQGFSIKKTRIWSWFKGVLTNLNQIKCTKDLVGTVRDVCQRDKSRLVENLRLLSYRICKGYLRYNSSGYYCSKKKFLKFYFFNFKLWSRDRLDCCFF